MTNHMKLIDDYGAKEQRIGSIATENFHGLSITDISKYSKARDQSKQALIDYIEGLENRWIDRSKRNPKERGRYLVYRAGICEVDFANFGTSKGWDNGRYRKDNCYRVTHWMPLPNKPEEG